MLHVIHTWDDQVGMVGFRTVHASPGVPAHVLEQLEQSSGMYVNEDGAGYSSLSHRLMRFHGAQWSVLTSVHKAPPIAIDGLNRVTHHVLIRADQRCSGPATLLASPLMCTNWPCNPENARLQDLPIASGAGLQAAHEWAPLLHQCQDESSRRVIALPQGQSAIKAIQSIEAAMQPVDRWSWTFSAGPPASSHGIAVIILESDDVGEDLKSRSIPWSDPPAAPSTSASPVIEPEVINMPLVRMEAPDRRMWPWLLFAAFAVILVILLWVWLGAAA